MELYNEEGKLINGATVKLCFVDAQSGKTIPAPEMLVEQLNPYFEET
jgi:acyl-CoA thioester hydrolase